MTFDLNRHTARLLKQEPFFAALSRKIDKRASTAIPTAGVRVNPDSGQFEMLYNPQFFEELSDTFEHVTGRLPAEGMSKIWNVATDLSINSHLIGKLPEKALIPGGKHFEDFPVGLSAEHYLELLKQKQQEQEESGEGQPGEGEGYETLDDHSGWSAGEDSEVDNTANEIAKERLKAALTVGVQSHKAFVKTLLIQ
jgi:predicted metal-dependent peptidase